MTLLQRFVLIDFIKPIVNKLLKDRTIKRWFFIRYADPEFHLRVRFQVAKQEHIGKIIVAIYKSINHYFNESLIYKIQLDSYQREVERYGENTIDAAENLFYYDSEMVTSLLNLIDDADEGEELRWLFGIKSIDKFLSDFGYSEDEKFALLESLKINFAHEFNMNNFLRKQLDKKYSIHQEKISNFIQLSIGDNSDVEPLLEIINRKSSQCFLSITNIKDLIDSENLNSFTGSQIHMMMNRLFRSKNRLHEFVVYYFLFKHYKIAWGKRKYLNNKYSSKLRCGAPPVFLLVLSTTLTN